MRLVATCLGSSPAALAEALRRAGGRLGEQDLLEARLDGLGRPPTQAELATLVEASRGRLLATCREGGPGTPPTEAERIALLGRAAAAGAAAIDAELGTGAVSLALPDGCERIVSHHEAEDGEAPSPAEARRLVESLCQTGASSLKLAAPTGDAAQALAWMRAARAAGGCRELTTIPLGPAGRGLRLLAGRDQSALLYCAEGEPAASGQPRLDDVLDLHHARDCDSSTPIYAVVGWPLDATWSPLLHGTLWREANRPGLLVPLPVREPAELLPLLETLGVTAAAVTMPHKQALATDSLSPSASVLRSGSLNSLRRGPGGWEAESFDGPAALAALGGVERLLGSRVAVVGAGGAAAALAAELAAAGIACVLLSRREGAARELAERLGVKHAPLASLEALSAEVVVNATPADPCEPLATRVAFDMRTTPPQTDWLRRAAAAGLETVDGLAMFARQAAAQQRWWGLSVQDEQVDVRLRSLVAERGGEAA